MTKGLLIGDDGFFGGALLPLDPSTGIDLLLGAELEDGIGFVFMEKNEGLSSSKADLNRFFLQLVISTFPLKIVWKKNLNHAETISLMMEIKLLQSTHNLHLPLPTIRTITPLATILDLMSRHQRQQVLTNSHLKLLHLHLLHTS